MVLLHGGMSYGMLAAVIGGPVIFVINVILFHFVARKTKFYNTEFIYFNSVQKFLYYLLFLVVNFFFSFIIAIICVGIFSWFFEKL